MQNENKSGKRRARGGWQEAIEDLVRRSERDMIMCAAIVCRLETAYDAIGIKLFYFSNRFVTQFLMFWSLHNHCVVVLFCVCHFFFRSIVRPDVGPEPRQIFSHYFVWLDFFFQGLNNFMELAVWAGLNREHSVSFLNTWTKPVIMEQTMRLLKREIL